MNIKNIFAKIKPKPSEEREKQVFKVQNDKNKYILVLRMLSILILSLLSVFVLVTIFFVYQTIMNTIGQVQSISLYQSELRIELIDFNRLEKIEKKWKEKTADEKEKLIINPFIKTISVPSLSITTTTPGNSATPSISLIP